MSQTSDYVGKNIVKIVDNEGSFYGTGFCIEIQQKNYYITCHHCIYELNEVFIERDGEKCGVEWMEEFSDMGKDIAVLKADNCGIVKAITYAKEAMPRLGVIVWGFSDNDLNNFPQGSPIEDGSLSSAAFPFHWPEESKKGSQKWNEKPQLNVNVFRFLGKFDLGYSRSPVCYSANNNIIGIFTAKDSDNGYIIPIQTVLKKFEREKNNVIDPSDTIDSGSIIDQGNRYFNRGNFVDAIGSYEKILNDANYFIALYNKGLSLDNLEKYNDAIACYDKAIEIHPNDTDLWYSKGLALYNLSKYNDAIACYDKAIEIDPNDTDVWYNKGLTLDDAEKYIEALKNYDKAIALNPNYVDAWNNKGVILDDMEKYNDAIACYDKAIALNPNHVDAWNNKGVTLSNLEKYNDAIACCDKAIEINEKYVDAWYNRAIYGNKMKYNTEEVLADLHKSIEIGGEHYKRSAKKETAFKNLRNKKAFKLLIKL